MLDSRIPKRLIAKIDCKNGFVVKGIMLEGVQRVGDPLELALKYYNQGIDEIILSDVVASLYQRNELPSILTALIRQVFVPVCACGGISSIAQAEALFRSGADKIAVNTGSHERPQLLEELAKEFGSQSVVAQIDTRPDDRGRWQPFYNSGRDKSRYDLSDWIRLVQDRGVGEILLTSIARDGTRKGADISLFQLTENLIKVPTILSGGVSSVNDLVQLFTQTGCEAVALGTALHVDQIDVGVIKQALATIGICIRQ
jgi:imidazole glycerol-phosphate synthase subunit HisF